MNRKDLDNLYPEYKEETENGSEHYEASGRRTGKYNSSGHRMSGFTGVVVGLIAGALICSCAFGLFTTSSSATVMELDYESKIELILSYLELYYLNDLDEDMIENALAKGLLENIGDKYAEYYTPEEFNQMLDEMTGEYAGIGVQIVMTDENKVEVYKVFNDSPAKEAGIQIKDLIVEADGVRDFETLDDLVSIVRGDPGTTVDLVIERNGGEIAMTVERRVVTTESIYYSMLSDDIGYIQITEFTTTTVPQFNKAIDDLLEQGMTSVIMDLRDDPGGDYDAVVSMCDRVLPEGPIVSVENRSGGISTENSDANCLDIPIVLLVNENTASAAELFSMALHDYDKAEIVGMTTYGKGIVQSIFRLMDGSGLKFTTEKYYGPNGNSIQDTGVEPDYIVELPEEVYEDGVITMQEDLQLKKAAELLGYTIPEDQEWENSDSSAGTENTEETADPEESTQP